MAQPAGRILGDVLGKVAGLALEPVGALADIGKANLMRFVKKLEKEERENPENIIPTKPSVAVPILEKMRYNDEDALAEAYAELLKNSCLKDRQAKVLPAYSE
ncbi:MAG: Abi-alpha family protein, partial [Gammaproteobacteria bacterium]|nr:Abi-alpha family protein [Gammaproteobacteria bacterium]